MFTKLMCWQNAFRIDGNHACCHPMKVAAEAEGTKPNADVPGPMGCFNGQSEFLRTCARSC